MASSNKLHNSGEVRNIAFVGHAGSGKTTLIEALLARAGMIDEAGSVQKGTTVTDFLAQEKQLQHSLDTAVCHLESNGAFLNIIDTPGYPDFSGRSMSVLSGVETTAIVIDSQAGLEMMTHQMMEFAAERRLCRMIIINKIDQGGANLHALLREIRDTFGKVCLPINLPANQGQTVVDCFFKPSDQQPDFASIEDAHTAIVDQVVELDDELMELYLEQGDDLTLDQLHDTFERALRRGHIVPVCFVSAETGSGINQLLDIFIRLMPNPSEGNPPEFHRGEGDQAKQVVVSSDPDAHFIGHVFKVNVDPYIGRLGVFRVHQGKVKTGDQIFIGERRKSFKVAHLYRLQGATTTEVSAGVPGDICAISKVDELHFDAVLHSSHDEDQFHMQSVPLAAPMYGVAIELNHRGEEKKLSDALHKLIAEDPSLRLEFDAQANETVLRGMGELHLRIVLERMKDEFKLEINIRVPKVAYRETVMRKAEGHHRHKKQTGGAGQFGEVYLRVEPLPRDSGFEFVNKIVGASIPGQFIPAIEKGVRQVLGDGAIAGYPMQDVRVVVHDGKHHPVDSKEVAFVAAGKKAFLDAITKAKPVLLEPIATVKITTPGDYVGDITGHLSGVRGRISGSDTLTSNKVRISAQVPVSELGDYQTTLKSLTGGEGVFTMAIEHYAAVPTDVQKSLEEQFRPTRE